MTIPFTARPVSSTAALLADYAAVRRRLFKPKIRPKPVEVIALPKPAIAAPRTKLVDCDAHVRTWRRWLASAGSPLKNYIVFR